MSWRARNTWLDRAADRWRPRRVEPLLLRVYLRSAGLAVDLYNGIQIEGALQHAVACRESGRMPADVFADKPREVSTDIRIPIEDVTIEGRAIACASWGRFPPCAIETVRWKRKRARAEELRPPGGSGMMRITGGPLKAINVPIAIITTPWVDFHVRGDRDLLAEICGAILCLGAHRSMSEVMGIEITDDPDDASLWRDDQPQRSIPVPEGTTEARWCSTRAPYHRRDTHAWCITPEIFSGDP